MKCNRKAKNGEGQKTAECFTQVQQARGSGCGDHRADLDRGEDHHKKTKRRCASVLQQAKKGNKKNNVGGKGFTAEKATCENRLW